MLTLPRILRSPQLPSLPAAAIRLLELSRDPGAGTGDFVKVVESDPAIAAKILKLSNSSFFAFRNPIGSVQRAVVLLGMNTVTSMALSFSVARQSTGKGKLAPYFERYWQQSVLQATAADVLADRIPNADRSELFLLGLMLDIGQLAMLCAGGKSYGSVLEAAFEDGRPLAEIERDECGFDHQTVGYELLAGWQFPREIVELVARHHDDEALTADGEPIDVSVSAKQIGLARLVAAVGEYFYPTADSATASRDRLLAVSEATFGLSPAETDRLLDRVSDQFRENADLFDADPDDIPDPSEIMAMVNEELATQALRATQDKTRLERDREAIEAEKQRVEQERDLAAQERDLIEQKKAELQQENEKLRVQAINDPLTEMYNRQFFDETFAAELDICQRTGKPIGLLFADVDKFKSINDVYGHPFGDEVLVRVADVLKTHTRKSDIAARYGGEEFVLLARQPSEAGLKMLAERIRTAVESLALDCDGTPVPITISIGAAHAIPRRSEPDLDGRLLAEADGAMYESKRSGRNRVTLRSMLTDEQRELDQMVRLRRFSTWLVAGRHVEPGDAMHAVNRSLPPGQQLGEMAEENGLLTRDQVDELLAAQIEGGMHQRIGELAIARGYLDQNQLATLLALQAESPARVAQTLVKLDHLTPTRAAELHERYLAETLPQAAAVGC